MSTRKKDERASGTRVIQLEKINGVYIEKKSNVISKTLPKERRQEVSVPMSMLLNIGLELFRRSALYRQHAEFFRFLKL